MLPRDLFLYLIGNRGAIERIAASKGAVRIGALLVLTAGIARNYDHLDLLREPEWFLAPFLVSLVSAGAIFLSLRFRLGRGEPHHQRHRFLPFLALFWMTAPCAWLYAIPVEAFTDLLTATRFNVALLAIVALWRVALITRAVQVLTGGKLAFILLAVLVPACGEAWLGSVFSGLSLVGIMGGVRLPPHHEFLQDASNTVATLSFWLGAILAPFFLLTPRRHSRVPRSFVVPTTMAGRPGWIATFVIVGLWIAVALPLQPKMQRRHHLQSLLSEGRFESAIRYAGEQGPDGFASWHYLPPDPFARRFSYAELFAAMDGSEPEWLRTTWLEQSIEALKLQLGRPPLHYAPLLESYRQVRGGREFLLSREWELRESFRNRHPYGPNPEADRKAFDEIFAKLKGPPLPNSEEEAGDHRP